MPTPAQLRRMADEAEREAGRLTARAAVLTAQAAELRRLARTSEGLPHTVPKDKLGTDEMEATQGAKVSRGKVKTPWPFQQALHRRGLSLPDWVAAQKRPAVGLEVAKSWLKRKGHGGHRISEEWADRIEATFVNDKGVSEVPAVDASWPCGIRRTGG